MLDGGVVNKSKEIQEGKGVKMREEIDSAREARGKRNAQVHVLGKSLWL